MDYFYLSLNTFLHHWLCKGNSQLIKKKRKRERSIYIYVKKKRTQRSKK